MFGLETVREFLESSSIHGLAYIASNRRLVRLFWLCVVISGFIGAGVLIHQSLSSWTESPVSTTIDTRSITDLDFPNVTVCPPRNSFTSLYPDLVMARNVTFNGEERKELADFVPLAVFSPLYDTQYLEFQAYRQETYWNWYTGMTKLALPYTDWDNNKIQNFGIEASWIFLFLIKVEK